MYFTQGNKILYLGEKKNSVRTGWISWEKEKDMVQFWRDRKADESLRPEKGGTPCRDSHPNSSSHFLAAWKN